jgi:hypothetical protein
MRSLDGTGFCPICHCDGDKHLLVNCPLLAELNLRLVKGPPPTAALALVPPGHVPAASPSPGGRPRLLTDFWLLVHLVLMMFTWDWLQLLLTRSTTRGMTFVGKAMNMVLALQAFMSLGVTLTTTLPSTLLAFMQLLRPLLTSRFLKILHQCTLGVVRPLCPLFLCRVALSSHANSATLLNTFLLLPFSQALVTVSLLQTQALLIICFRTSPLSFLTSW